MLLATPKNRLPQPPKLTEKERWEAVKSYRDPRRTGRWFVKDGAPVTDAAKAEAQVVATSSGKSRHQLKRERAAAKALRKRALRDGSP